MMDFDALLQELPTERRLALAYAPARAKQAFLGLLLLDLRLSRLLARKGEPMLVQLRLAWWRDRLGEAPGRFHQDEPALALVSEWGDRRGELAGLVDGWEALLVDPPLTQAAANAFIAGRGAAFAVLAQALGHADAADEARRLAENWAIADLANRIEDPAEREIVIALGIERDWTQPALPADLRPLAVLHGLALRDRGKAPLLQDWRSGLAAVRLGILGR